MNDPEINPQDASQPMDAQDTSDDLRRHLNLLFAALLISSFTLTAYLGLQGKRAAGDLAILQTRALEQFNQNQQDMAGIHSIYLKLTDFARTHPDFQARILSRYNFDTNSLVQPAKK
jgi:hypothetical protein